MLYGFLLTLYIINCLLLALLILLQQGKSSLGIGALGGGSQILFGGSGGQELFQKMTWIMGAILLIGSLSLSIMKSSGVHSSRYVNNSRAMNMPITETEVDSFADIIEEPAQ